MPTPTAMSLRPLSRAIDQALPRASRGFGLLSILVTVALSTAVLGVAYTAYEHNERATQIDQSAEGARAISQRVLASYAGAASFVGLSTQSALHDGLFPAAMLSDSMPQSAWGSSVEIAPVNLAGPSGPGSNNGFAITFDAVPADLCSGVAINGGQGFYNVKVGGQSVMDGPHPNPVAINTMCSSGASIQFIQAKVSPEGAQLSSLSACTVQPAQYQPAACPAGQISSVPPYSANGIIQKRTSFCNAAYGPVGWSPWTPSSDTCAPQCVAPAPQTQTKTTNQDLGCTGGWTGQRIFAVEYSQTRTATCPSPTGSYVWGAYSPWAATGNKTLVSNTCAAPPTAPPPTAPPTGTPSPTCGAAPAPVSQPVSCPSGQTGTATQSHGWTSTPSPTCWTASPWTTTSSTCTTPTPHTWTVTNYWSGTVDPVVVGAPITVCDPHSYTDAGAGGMAPCNSTTVGTYTSCSTEDSANGTVFDTTNFVCK